MSARAMSSAEGGEAVILHRASGGGGPCEAWWRGLRRSTIIAWPLDNAVGGFIEPANTSAGNSRNRHALRFERVAKARLAVEIDGRAHDTADRPTRDQRRARSSST